MFRKLFQMSLFVFAILLASCAPAIPTATSQSTAIPQPTAVPQSTSTPSTQQEGSQSPLQPPIMNLSTSDLNSTAPQGVLNEITYMGGMGGPGADCDVYNYQSPTILIDSLFQNPQRMGTILIHVCGLSSNGENVDVQVDVPDGTVRHSQLISKPTSGQNYNQVDYYSVVELNDPIGAYHFIFNGNGWTLDQYLTVSDVSNPKLIRDTDTDELIFIGFQPNENVQLLVYSPTVATLAKLVGWKSLQVNGNGQLIIHPDLPSSDDVYIAIGSISGVVDLYDKGGWSPSSFYSPVK